MLRVLTAALALIVVAMTTMVSGDQIRIPRLPRSIPTEIPRIDRLPSIDDLLGRDPLTTSLDDAVTEVAFLDRFDPPKGSPLLELPMGLDDGVTLVPGLWDAHVQSYCLKAGTFGPSRGDGYLWAPFKGPKADVINAILNKSAFNESIPQHDIQVLLWGIIARTRVGQLPEGPRRAAQTLLSESQIASIDGSALDVIPDDWIRKITGPLNSVVRRALEAENRLRQAFANPGAAAYDELERIAVLNGMPPVAERGREVKARRWSFHPNGYFIRFMPNSYTNMQLQIYVPERFSATRTGDRITSLSDATGARLNVTYGADGSIANATFIAANGATESITVKSGNAVIEEAREAARDAARFVGAARAQSARALDVRDVALMTASITSPAASAFLSRAWASAVGDWAHEAPPQAQQLVAGPHYLLASFGSSIVQRSSMGGGGWGGGGGGGSGGGGGGGGGMPGGGKQRLGPSLRKFADDPTANRARKAIDTFNNAKQGLDLATDPSGILGFGIPDALFGKILDFNFDKWGQASDALAGDPPRDDFREFTLPKIETVPQLKAGSGLSAAQADRLNALIRDLAAVNAHFDAAIVALDRHGGAVKANERAWASRQAQALTYLKREGGVLSLKVAAELDALVGDAEKMSARRVAALKDTAAAVRDLGEHFASLPRIDPPWQQR
jgi:hypothetical protein